MNIKICKYYFDIADYRRYTHLYIKSQKIKIIFYPFKDKNLYKWKIDNSGKRETALFWQRRGSHRFGKLNSFGVVLAKLSRNHFACMGRA
ncbi:hypothetical protein [Thermaerobacillus caldiproteolyticus]|uniref:hypothetical protein n=1 Tax=Thermaerobacillus caldiproteolyticus TaxID=247480 RepID=UPI00188D00B4|nr:hypothetical protein [Anoxybacillus caldiproteolyticus]QPA30557.1 hypothetical protein ISX45_13320 [Anoxybacillus caldiproteolyticus]